MRRTKEKIYVSRTIKSWTDVKFGRVLFYFFFLRARDQRTSTSRLLAQNSKYQRLRERSIFVRRSRGPRWCLRCNNDWSARSDKLPTRDFCVEACNETYRIWNSALFEIATSGVTRRVVSNYYPLTVFRLKSSTGSPSGETLTPSSPSTIVINRRTYGEGELNTFRVSLNPNHCKGIQNSGFHSHS